jgi:hypothetical protein
MSDEKMQKLSIRDGHPIAKIVKNPKYTMLYLQDENSDSDSDDYEIDPYDIYSEDYVMKKDKIRNARNFSYPQELKKQAMDLKYKEFHIKTGFLEPIPDINLERDMLFVAGPSGSGKSTYIATYLKNYKKCYPKNKIFIFSKLTHDPAFDKLKPKYVPITIENFITQPIQISELSDSCCVFDDIDVISDKVLCRAVQQLRDQCLEIGRHEKISVCATSHQLMNYNLTRTLINEAQNVTMFPKSGSTHHIKNFLKTYGGMDKKAIDRATKLPSRWITIHKNYPMYIMYSQGCYLLN